MAMKETFRNFRKRIVSLFGKNTYNSKRRSRLGVGVQNLNHEGTRNYRICPAGAPLFVELPDELLGAKVLERNQLFEMLRRAKLYLALRSVEDFDLLLGLDWRRVWNQEQRVVETLLDLFPSLKFAHESMLPLTARLRKRGIDPKSIDWKNSPWYRQYLCDFVRAKDSLFFDAEKVLKSPGIPTAKDLFRYDYVDVVASEKNGNGNVSVRFDDICRSHSIWLDPVDAPKELYKWRLRIQKAIAWAYLNDCVPVMMTLTIFHRWQHLKNLLNVLQNSWDNFFVSSWSARKRRAAMDLQGYVRRLEITLNDGLVTPDGEILPNAGWHPHFHVILFVSKDKFGTVSDMEAQMKKDWVKIVAAQFKKEFGEEIDASYMPAFEAHGLHFSRYNKGERKGKLRSVKDSIYLDKIEGYDHLHVYGIDKEVSADVIKDSKIPFDLLREVTASNIDLWAEYAIATKGLPALQFSRPIIKKINKYFAAHPDKNPVTCELPPSKVIAHMDFEILRLFYRNFLIPQLRQKAAEGFDELSCWVKEKLIELGVSALCDDPTALPRPPNSVDDLLSKKILPTP